MDDDVLVPRPRLEGMFAMLSDKSVAFNASSAGIEPGDNDIAGHGVTTNCAVGEPYLVSCKKPIGVMGEVKLSPALTWVWRFKSGRHVVLD